MTVDLLVDGAEVRGAGQRGAAGPRTVLQQRAGRPVRCLPLATQVGEAPHRRDGHAGAAESGAGTETIQVDLPVPALPPELRATRGRRPSCCSTGACARTTPVRVLTSASGDDVTLAGPAAQVAAWLRL